MIGSNMIDGSQFFKEKLQTIKTPMFYKSKIGRILGNRVFGFAAWAKGKITFFEAIRNCLPSGAHVHGADIKILEELKTNLDTTLKENKLYDLQAIYFFGKRFIKAGEKTDFESWFHTFIMFFQCVIADQYHASKFLKSDSIVIDAGANAGMFSVAAANICKSGMIYGFEPTPRTFSILKSNSNEYPNIKVFNLALGSEEGSGTLAVAESSGSNSLSDSGIADASSEKIIVKINSIDNFVKENELARVDFIKIDTEGYEYKILQGAKETIKRFSPVLSMSAYHHAEDREVIPKLIMSLNPNYKCRLTGNVEDNLLFWV